jgi:hypothetical protein
MSALVLDDETILGFLSNPQRAQFPCLQFFKVEDAPPCNCPGKAAQAKKSMDGNAVRTCILGLGADRQAALKKLLGVDQLLIFVSTPGFPRRTVL